MSLTKPSNRPIYLCVGHIHASGIEPVLYLLSVVNLQQVVASELYISELLVMFKEVNGEVHLAACASCYKRRDRCIS